VLDLWRQDANGGRVLAPMSVEAASPNVPAPHKELAPATMKATYQFAAVGAQPALMRNQGTAGWADRTADFPFVKGAASNGQKLRVDADSKAFDLAVFYRDRGPVLYRDQLGGRYTVETVQWTPPVRTQVDADFDDDGDIDVTVPTAPVPKSEI